MNYIHKKTGNIYRLLNIANECDSEKFPKMAIYISLVDGALYARPLRDFNIAFDKLEVVG